ncbi:head-tail connector protein [Paracoccus nototheniae]|nr:head-tail connector protein [Paracoccus nototheniae]
MSVTVPELRAQLNLEHELDDSLLTQKIEAASAYCASYIGKPIPDRCPAAIKQGVMMLAAFWFDIRSAGTTGGNPVMVPMGCHDLLQAHRAWAV